MHAERHAQIQRSLSTLAENYAALMKVMEQTFALLVDQASQDPEAYFQNRHAHQDSRSRIVVDRRVFTVSIGGKSCFLGNTYPFRLLARLSQRPNIYIAYEDLLSDVWQGIRSNDAVRSAVKMLRRRLREAGLGDVADSIDGSVRGHYALICGDER